MPPHNLCPCYPSQENATALLYVQPVQADFRGRPPPLRPAPLHRGAASPTTQLPLAAPRSTKERRYQRAHHAIVFHRTQTTNTVVHLLFRSCIDPPKRYHCPKWCPHQQYGGPRLLHECEVTI